MNICVYGASSTMIDDEYIERVEKLGCTLAKRGHTLVYGAGANGLMGAIARGFTEGGGPVIGVAPAFFKADGVLYDKCTTFITTETMRERKKIMEDNADCFVMTPGGIGTFDEFFEIITLKQLGRHAKPIAVYNLKGYFNELNILMKKAVDEKMLSEKSLDLYKIVDNDNEIIYYLENTKEELARISDMKFVR